MRGSGTPVFASTPIPQSKTKSEGYVNHNQNSSTCVYSDTLLYNDLNYNFLFTGLLL